MVAKKCTSIEFLKHFIGREEEFAALIDAWAQVQRGNPHFVLLLADTGLGKTRLIHEFYRTLSNVENERVGGSGYWPDELDSDPISLRINPDLPEGERRIEDMPWFWWGLRWQQPDPRNAGGHRPIALLDADAQAALARHMEPFRRYLEKSSSGKHVISTFLKGLFGFFVSGPLELWDIIKAVYSWAHTPSSAEVIDFAAVLASRRREADERARDFLASLLDAEHPEMPTVPVVLVLDDAQWADSVTLRFVRNLLVEAVRNHWPLMVIATCWETDWKGNAASLTKPTPLDTDPENLNTLFAQLQQLLSLPRTGSNFMTTNYRQILMLPFASIKSLEPMIKAAFPGLGDQAREYLLSEADGNPKVLAELLLQLKESPSHWFVDKSEQADLTPEGLRKLRELPTDHERIIKKKLKQLEVEEPVVYRVLALASPQGLRFYGKFLVELGRLTTWAAEEEISSALRCAESPRNLIRPLPGQLLPAQFKERFSWVILSEVCSARWPAAVSEYPGILLEWLGDGRLTSQSEAMELLELLIGLLAEQEATPKNRKLRCYVLGHMVATLQQRSRYGEAVQRALDLTTLAEAPPAIDLVAALDPVTQLGVARCLLEARRYPITIEFANARLAATNLSLSGPDEVRWWRLKAQAYHGLEKYKDAIDAWEQACAMAINLPLVEQRLDGLSTQLYIGLAETRHKKDGWRAAFLVYRRALDTLNSKGVKSQSSLADLQLTGTIYDGIAKTLYDGGRLASAVKAMQRAEDNYSRIETLASPIPEIIELHARCLTQRGEWLLWLVGEELTNGVAVGERAVNMSQNLIKKVGETVESLAVLAASKSMLAGALSNTEDHERALEFAEEGLALRHEVLSRVGEKLAAKRQLTLALVRRGDVLRRAGRTDEALRDYGTALEIRERLVLDADGKRDQRTRSDIRNLHYICRKIGEVHLEKGDLTTAAVMLHRAYDLSKRVLQLFQPEPTDLRNAYVGWQRLGELAERKNQLSVARRCLTNSISLIEKLSREFGASPASRRDHEKIKAALDRLEGSSSIG